jgi:hypothetical protein
VDFRGGLTVPRVERAEDGALHLALSRGPERLVVHLSYPSLEALWFELTVALAENRQCRARGPRRSGTAPAR